MVTHARHIHRRLCAVLVLCAVALALLAVVAVAAQAPMSRVVGAHIAIEPAAQRVGLGQVFTASIVIVSPQQPLQGVDAYLDFDPLRLAVVDAQGHLTSTLQPGEALPVILQNRVDGALGHINYSAGITLGTGPITGTLTVATIHFRRIGALPPQGTPLTFAFDQPSHRVTEVAYRGQRVLASHADGIVYPHFWLTLPIIWKHHDGYGR